MSIVCRVSVPVAEAVLSSWERGLGTSSSRLLGVVAAVGHPQASAILILELTLHHVQQKEQ
jgi:hypothetical protein